MVQLLSAHIVGPTMCVNLTLALDIVMKNNKIKIEIQGVNNHFDS